MMTTRTKTRTNPYFSGAMVVLAALAVAASVLLSVAGGAQAAFPGKNGKIVFSSDRTTGKGVSNPEGDAEIFLMNPNGTDKVQLTKNASEDTDPAFSPSGRQIAFVSSRDGNPEIYRMGAGGLGQTRLTNNPAVDTEPTWSPTGGEIAFSSNRDGNRDIYKMDSSGVFFPINLTRFQDVSATDPAWSPDGNKIAFEFLNAGRDIAVVLEDGSNIGIITADSQPGDDNDPSWSPNGRRIVYSSDRTGNEEIYKQLATDGAIATRLTNDPAIDSDPAFSPNGRQIVFATDRDGDEEIYKMGARGANPVDLSRNTALEERAPDWQPLSR